MSEEEELGPEDTKPMSREDLVNAAKTAHKTAGRMFGAAVQGKGEIGIKDALKVTEKTEAALKAAQAAQEEDEDLV